MKNQSAALFYIFSCMLFTHRGSSDSIEISKNRDFGSGRMILKTIDVIHIALDLNFDWTNKRANGKATLAINVLSPTDTLELDAVELDIHSIQLAKKTALQYRWAASQQKLRISLGRKYSVGETINVCIQYTTRWKNDTDPNNIWGSQGKGIRFLQPSSTEPNRRFQIWSMSDGESNSYWYPCNNQPEDLITSEFKARVMDKYTVVSAGQLIHNEDNKDGTRTFTYTISQPHPNHKLAFVVGEYEFIKNQFSDMMLNVYAYPEESGATLSTIVRLPEMVDHYADLTGKTYPFQSYAQVFVQELPWGYSGAGLSVLTENMVDDEKTHADYLYLWDMLEGESLANQWFGNYIYCSDWSEYWLEKGFSRYFSCLFDEYKNGKAEFLLYQLSFDQGIYFSDWNGGTRRPVVAPLNGSIDEFTQGNYPNSRGALVLHMLRKHLGEKDWRESIREYVKSFGGKSVHTRDFIHSINRATGQNMHWFFDQWIYKMGHPVFEINKRYDPAKKILTLQVRQTQSKDSLSAYPQQTFFKGKVLLELDDTLSELIIQPQYENIYYLNCDQGPRLVNFDYESTWIAEIKFEKSLTDWVYQLENSRDVLAKRKAINELNLLAQNEQTPESDRQKIYAAYRNIIAGKGYWRLRFNTIVALQNLLMAKGGQQALRLDQETRDILLTVIKHDSSWVRSAALNLMGLTRDREFVPIYLMYISDKSERVVNAAAIALGRSKDPSSWKALVDLIDHPSWKNQSLISSLNGFAELGDTNAIDIALKYLVANDMPHWTLATPVWDHRLASAVTLVRLGAGQRAFPLIWKQFNQAVGDDNMNDIFYNLLQLSILADPLGQAAFDQLKIKFKENENAMNAVTNLENQFKEAIKK